MCYYKVYATKGEDMRLLRLAIETQNWNLAAHTIVFATATVLHKVKEKNGERPHAKTEKEKEKGRSTRQPKR